MRPPETTTARLLLAAFTALALLAGNDPAAAANGDCGQPASSGSSPTATDALAVLRTAVGSQACPACTCDVDRSGTTSATDALAVLRAAVGQPVTLDCVACPIDAIIGPAGGSLTSRDGLLTIDVPAGALAGANRITIAGTALADLPAEFAGVTGADAYTLGPAGLEFITPAQARFDTQATVVGGSGDLSTALTLPYTLADDVVVPLSGVRIATDDATGAAVVATPIAHFSPIVYVREEGTGLTIAGAPDSSVVGRDHVVSVSVASMLAVDAASYADAPAGAWKPVGDPIGDVALERVGESDAFEGTFTYRCTSVDEGAVYAPEVTVELDNPNYASDGGAFLPPESPLPGQPATVIVTFAPAKDVPCTASQVDSRMLSLPGCTGPEGVNVASFPVTGACLDDASARLASFGCNEGTIAVDLDTDGIVYQRTGQLTTTAFASVTLLDPSGAEKHLVLQDGPQGYRGHRWTPATCDFDASVVTDPLQSIYTDVSAYDDDPTAGGALLSDNGADRVIGFDYDDAGHAFAGPTVRIDTASLGAVAGTVVSAFSNGPAAAIVGVKEIDPLNPKPGKLFFHDGSAPGATTVEVGEVGPAPRRIRCAGGVCAVSNAGDDTLTVAVWDGSSAPTIAGTVAVGATPIGIDLLDRGDSIAIASTGFADDTFTITEVDAAGSVLSSATSPVPTGCTNPGHVAWIDSTALVVSCKTSNDAVVIENVFGKR